MLSNFINKSLSYFYSLKAKPVVVFFLFCLYTFLLVGSASCDYTVEIGNSNGDQPDNGRETEERYSLSQLSATTEQKDQSESEDGVWERFKNLPLKEKKLWIAYLTLIGCLVGVVYLQQSDISQLDSKLSKLSGEVSQLKDLFSETLNSLNNKTVLPGAGSSGSFPHRSAADQETWVRPPGWKFGFGR